MLVVHRATDAARAVAPATNGVGTVDSASASTNGLSSRACRNTVLRGCGVDTILRIQSTKRDNDMSVDETAVFARVAAETVRGPHAGNIGLEALRGSADVGASLLAGAVCESARFGGLAACGVGSTVVAEARDASEVAQPPLTSVVRLASVLIRPSARLARANASRGVPVADTVGKTLGLACSEAQTRSACSGTRLPLAVWVSVTASRDSVLERALRSASAVAVHAHVPTAAADGSVLTLHLARR